MKTILILSTLFCAITLCGCSHDNPFTHMPTSDVGTFLAHASYQAEKALHAPHPQGRRYEQCLFHDRRAGVDCPTLYQYMLTYAQTQMQFQLVTLEDLTDIKQFYRIKEDYQAAVFMIVPGLHS